MKKSVLVGGVFVLVFSIFYVGSGITQETNGHESLVTWQWIAGAAVALAQALIFILMARSDKANTESHIRIETCIGLIKKENTEAHEGILRSALTDHDRSLRLEGRIEQVEGLCRDRHGPGRRDADRRKDEIIKELEDELTMIRKGGRE